MQPVIQLITPRNPSEEWFIQLLDQSRLPEFRVLKLRSLDDVLSILSKPQVTSYHVKGILGAMALVLEADRWGLKFACSGFSSEAPPSQLSEICGLVRRYPRDVSEELVISTYRRLVGLLTNGEDRTRFMLERFVNRSYFSFIQACKTVARMGSAYLHDRKAVFTIGSSGGLAFGEYGTALGAIRASWEEGHRDLDVFLCEDSMSEEKLSKWELDQAGVPATIVPPGEWGACLRRSPASSCVILQPDWVARNGELVAVGGSLALVNEAFKWGVPVCATVPFFSVDPSLEKGSLFGERLDSGKENHRCWDVIPVDSNLSLVSEQGVSPSSMLPFRLVEKERSDA